MKYERGVGSRAAPADVKFYSAKRSDLLSDLQAGAGTGYYAQRDHRILPIGWKEFTFQGIWRKLVPNSSMTL